MSRRTLHALRGSLALSPSGQMRDENSPYIDSGGIVEIKLSYWGILEARVGIEPTHKGFADLSLTAWVPRLTQASLVRKEFEPPNLTAAEV